jgi:hypothetical protein
MPADDGGSIDETHRRILAVIQPVLRKYGFGLAGGNAMKAHGLTHRPTRDINMFTMRAGAIKLAVPEVERALKNAGFGARATRGAEAALVGDWDDYNARWTVTAGEERVLLELALHDLISPPVLIADIGPVLTVEDLLAAKTLALVDRSGARDFWDVYEAMRQGWTPEQLIGLAWRLNPDDYDAAYFTEVLGNLADLDDFEFRQLGLSGRQVTDLRAAFEGQWPRRNG